MVSQNRDSVSEVGFLTEGLVGDGRRPEWQGDLGLCPWEGGSVLPFVCFSCIIDATLFPLVCVCIDFLVYGTFPCQDLFLFFQR